MTDADDTNLVNRRAAALSALLAASDAAPRPVAFPADRVARAARHGVQVRRLRIAAATALLLAGAGVPPVRAWIVDSVRSIWSRVAGAARPVARPDTAVAPAAPGAGTMGSVTIPVGDAFTLRVASRQAAGAITIETFEGPSASATVTGERDAAELVVLPDGLRIVNARGGSAGYLLRVPASIGRVTLLIGRETPRVFRPDSAGQRWVVELGALRNVR